MPDVMLLPKLATFFDISIDELMGYEPQLSKEQIRKLYHDFCIAFAEESFDKTMGETKEYVKKYYSCYPFLYQICVLWLNHVEIAGSPEAQRAVLSDTKELCSHIVAHCSDRGICQDAVSIGAIANMQLGNAMEAVEALETIVDPLRLVRESDSMLIQAYIMAQEREKAEAFTQLSMYVHLAEIINSGILFLVLHEDNMEICEETIQRLTKVAEAYDLSHLNANVSGILKYHAAVVYCKNGRVHEALTMLSGYVEDICFLLSGEQIYKRCDRYFNQIDSWYEKLSLGEIPRDKRIIFNNFAQSFYNPAFSAIKDSEEFTRLMNRVHQIQESFE